jgi:GDP-4-dehydro-6-deoxy-D-mannose reductase
MTAKRRTLVTGVTGFAGGHLAELLLAGGQDELHGLARRAEWPAASAHLASRVAVRTCDLTDCVAVEAVLRALRPDHIYHLAGYAATGRSFREPDAAWAGNLAATRCLYDAVVRWGGRPRILFVGSGLVYGNARTPAQTQDETCLLQPDSPYAASKAAADLASYQYTCHPGLDIVRARPFNHIGPGQQPGFVLADFARQLVAVERGQRPAVLETGNLSPQRDLTDVRDMVAAYVQLMEKGQTGEAYNIGRGESVAIATVLERLVALSGRSVQVRQRADLVRGLEPALVRVDASKMRSVTGWTARHTLEQTLADTLDWWRKQP